MQTQLSWWSRCSIYRCGSLFTVNRLQRSCATLMCILKGWLRDATQSGFTVSKPCANTKKTPNCSHFILCGISCCGAWTFKQTYEHAGREFKELYLTQLQEEEGGWRGGRFTCGPRSIRQRARGWNGAVGLTDSGTTTAAKESRWRDANWRSLSRANAQFPQTTLAGHRRVARNFNRHCEWKRRVSAAAASSAHGHRCPCSSVPLYFSRWQENK